MGILYIKPTIIGGITSAPCQVIIMLVSLRLAIKKFESLIPETLQASHEELKVIREYSKYLSEALERLNRFDWRGLAIATILAISIALSLDTEKGKILFNLFKDILSSFGYLLQ